MSFKRARPRVARAAIVLCRMVVLGACHHERETKTTVIKNPDGTTTTVTKND
jgi:hypothetical protein